jgi:subtilisin family serine protease
MLALALGSMLLAALPASRDGKTVLSPLLRMSRGPLATSGESLRVTARLVRPADREILRKLARVGAEPIELPTGGLAQVGTVISLRVPRAKLDELARVPEVLRVEPARPPMTLAPLDRTTERIGARQLWSPPRGQRGSDGSGVLLADHEGGWDIFHPDFFLPDGGLFTAADQNGDGAIGPGDLVDLDGDGSPESPLSLLEGSREDVYTGESDYRERGYQPDVDWLYVDGIENGRRDFGRQFGDRAPAFGEQIFVGDDVNGDGRVSGGERLVRLGTSKVRAVWSQGTLYERGRNLSQYPVHQTDPSHGTGAIGIAAAGWPELRRYTGVAPAADLLLIDAGEDPIAGLSLALQLGAQVNFYEWSSLLDVGDGSSNIEAAISQAADTGSVQVAAAGNLAGSDHCIVTSAGTSTRSISFTTDGQGFFQYNAFFLSLTWIGDASELRVALSLPNGERTVVPVSDGFFELSGFQFESAREVTSRGTARVILVGYSPNQGSPIPQTTLTVSMSAARTISELRGTLVDDQSGWSRGVAWLSDQSDIGTALMPATSDHVITVGAFGGNHDLGELGFGDREDRRTYSGVGPRLDGAPVVDLTAPDDPFTTRSDAASPHGAYTAFGGTSGALPHVAGAAALLVAVRPSITHAEIERILTEGAIADGFTGMVPSSPWGHGKLHVGHALHGDVRPIGRPPRFRLEARQPLEIDRVGIVRAVVESDSPEILIEWDRDYDRRYETGPSVDRQIAFSAPAPGRYPVVARAIDPEGRTSRAIIEIEVVEPCPPEMCGPPDAGPRDTGPQIRDASPVPPLPEDAGPSSDGGGTRATKRILATVEPVGCGCRAAGGRTSASAAVGLALVLATSTIRRRRRSCGR